MKRSTSVALGLLGFALLAGCGQTSQLDETRAYLARIEAVGETLDKEGEAFAMAMVNAGGPDMAAIASIGESLDKSIATLQGEKIADAKLAEAHARLLAGVTALRDGVALLEDVMADPAAADEGFETELQAKLTLAGTEMQAWTDGIAAILPEAERAEFLEKQNAE